MYYTSYSLIERSIFTIYKTHQGLVLQCSVLSWPKIHSNKSCSGVWRNNFPLLSPLSLWQMLPPFFNPPTVRDSMESHVCLLYRCPGWQSSLSSDAAHFALQWTSHPLFCLSYSEAIHSGNIIQGYGWKGNVWTTAERVWQRFVVKPLVPFAEIVLPVINEDIHSW